MKKSVFSSCLLLMTKYDSIHRSRDDTVRCIVRDMIDPDSDLFKELAPLTNGNDDDDTEFENEEDEDWEPMPVELRIENIPLSRRKKDIIRSLIDIYGSKDTFIKEYQFILADKLLNRSSYEIEQEVRIEKKNSSLIIKNTHPIIPFLDLQSGINENEIWTRKSTPL
jgi:hypothetical protein